jgi:type II secretory pathway pseudopilin PulG
MVALLVAMSVMAVLMTAAMPTWRHIAQREKEAELIFRGEQYARAIGLFQRRAGPGVNPPNVDILIQQRFLRKKYKDPITGEDFELLSPLSQAAGFPGGPVGSAQPGRSTVPGRGAAPSTGTPPGRGFSQPSTPGSSAFRPGAPGAPAGGIIGVASKSKDKSIRLYNGRNYYNEWQFIYVPQVQQPGGRGGRGAPDASGTGRGQRGQQPFGQPPFGPGGPGRGRGTPPGAPGRGFPGSPDPR